MGAGKRHGKNYRRFGGPSKRINVLRTLVTELLRYERIEVTYAGAHEMAPYVEKLINMAKKYGDSNQDAMKMFDFWIREKDLIHKLLKVLAVRYKDQDSEMVKFHRVFDENQNRPQAIIELINNPFPLIPVDSEPNSNNLLNVLIRGVAQDRRATASEDVLDKWVNPVAGRASSVASAVLLDNTKQTRNKSITTE